MCAQLCSDVHKHVRDDVMNNEIYVRKYSVKAFYIYSCKYLFYMHGIHGFITIRFLLVYTQHLYICICISLCSLIKP